MVHCAVWSTVRNVHKTCDYNYEANFACPFNWALFFLNTPPTTDYKE